MYNHNPSTQFMCIREGLYECLNIDTQWRPTPNEPNKHEYLCVLCTSIWKVSIAIDEHKRLKSEYEHEYEH